METTDVREEELDQRLELIREGLAADGYALLVSLPGPNAVRMHVQATSDACEDCLVPKSIFLDIVAAELDGVVRPEQIEILYPGEEADVATKDTDRALPPASGVSQRAWTLSSARHHVVDWDEMQRLAADKRWSDGLPVVPPTPAKVEALLGTAGLEPDETVGEASERSVTITAEAVAVNAVMAGMERELMPVLVAAIEAVSDPQFKFNHLASIGSPWPLFLVSGPAVDTLGIHSGLYVFGPEAPANAQLSRAFSFTLRNHAYAINSGIQRGQWGNPIRWQAFIGEDPQSPWGPMHTDLGFPAEETVVTAVSLEPGAPYQIKLGDQAPESMMAALCEATADWGAALFCRGTYVVMIGPHQAQWLHEQGWSRADVRAYVLDNTRTTVAALKRRRAWGHVDEVPDELRPISPEDEETYVYLFKENEEVDQYVWIQSALEGRELDVRIIVSGGDAGRRFSVGIPYEFSTNAVSRTVRLPER